MESHGHPSLLVRVVPEAICDILAVCLHEHRVPALITYLKLIVS